MYHRSTLYDGFRKRWSSTWRTSPSLRLRRLPPAKVLVGLLCLHEQTVSSGVEFRWSWGTAILALEKFELMRAPRQFQWLVRGTKANLKILKGHHGKLCSYSHLTSYIFLKLKDEREGAGLACPSFGNCIELFSLVKTLLTIDKTTHWQGRAPRQEVKRVQHYTAVTRSQI